MKKIIAFTSITAISVALFSCLRQDYNPPPDLSKVDPNLPVDLTIAALKNHFATVATGTPIDSDWTIYGIVTTEDRAGNFYKQVTIEDSTGGITIAVDANSLYTKLPVGRKVYVKLKGLSYGFYNKLPQIGYSVDGAGGVTRIPQNAMDKYIVRANYPNALPLNSFDGLAQLSVLNNRMLNRLVRIDNVEVIPGDLGKTYAEQPDVSSGTGITVRDCYGNTISFAIVPMLPSRRTRCPAVTAASRPSTLLSVRNPSWS